MGKARILCFTGDGKGKTTAALGMGLRAAGHGMGVLIIQFLKADQSTGELKALEKLPAIRIVQSGRGFLPPEESPKFQEHKDAAGEGVSLARRTLENRECRVLILDEICVAVSKNLVSEQEVLDLLHLAREDMTVVMTGRGATSALVEAADTVTEMRCVKHGYDRGIRAGQGVEF